MKFHLYSPGPIQIRQVGFILYFFREAVSRAASSGENLSILNWHVGNPRSLTIFKSSSGLLAAEITPSSILFELTGNFSAGLPANDTPGLRIVNAETAVALLRNDLRFMFVIIFSLLMYSTFL